MNLKNRLYTISIFALALVLGCNTQPPAKLVYDQAISGQLEGRRYINDYFEFTVEIPDDWELKVENLDEFYKQSGRKQMKEELHSAMDNARPQIEYILKANRRSAEPPDTPFLQFGVSIHHISDIKNQFPTQRDYLNQQLKELRLGAIRIRMIEPPHATSIQGQEFDVMSYFVQFKQIATFQRSYVRYVGEHALRIHMSYATDEHVAIFKDLISEQDTKLP